MRGFASAAARSRTFSSSRSLGYVSAIRAPAAAAACAIAQEIDRLLATPTIRPCLPERSEERSDMTDAKSLLRTLSAAAVAAVRHRRPIAAMARQAAATP